MEQACGTTKATQATKATKATKAKRRPSAYNLFVKDRTAFLKRNHPDWNPQECLKNAAAAWATLPKHRKAHFEAMAREGA